MTANRKLSAKARLDAAAEVVAFVHWRLAQLHAGAEPTDAGLLPIASRHPGEPEQDWLMRMLGSAADDLLALSMPAPQRLAKPLSTGPRKRRAARRVAQGEMEFERHGLRIIQGGRS